MYMRLFFAIAIDSPLSLLTTSNFYAPAIGKIDYTQSLPLTSTNGELY
jgi:hypothetical protein